MEITRLSYVHAKALALVLSRHDQRPVPSPPPTHIHNSASSPSKGRKKKELKNTYAAKQTILNHTFCSIAFVSIRLPPSQESPTI